MLCSLLCRRGVGGRAAMALAGVLCMASPALADDAGRKYRADFEGGFPDDVHAEWSESSITRAPAGQAFLGPFSNKAVTLTLTELPPHRFATVSFDLYVIGPWDGQSGPRRPTAAGDAFSCRVVEGEVLIYSTFAVPRPGAVLRQSFPREITGFRGASAAGTGASGIGTLGYEFAGEPMDAVFPMNFRFAHSQGSITIEFAGSGLDMGTEQWGIDNVEVALVDEDNPTGEPDELITEDTFSGVTGDEGGQDDGYFGAGGGADSFVGSNPFAYSPGGSNFPLMYNSGGGGGSSRVNIVPPNTPTATSSEDDDEPADDGDDDTPDVNDEDNPPPPPPPPPDDDDDDDVDPPPPPPTPTPGTLAVTLAVGLAMSRRRR